MCRESGLHCSTRPSTLAPLPSSPSYVTFFSLSTCLYALFLLLPSSSIRFSILSVFPLSFSLLPPSFLRSILSDSCSGVFSLLCLSALPPLPPVCSLPLTRYPAPPSPPQLGIRETGGAGGEDGRPLQYRGRVAAAAAAVESSLHSLWPACLSLLAWKQRCHSLASLSLSLC